MHDSLNDLSSYTPSRTKLNIVRACVLALDDKFYYPGEYKRVDFSCNTQFGSYCAESLNSVLKTDSSDESIVTLIDAGVTGEKSSLILKQLATLRPDILVVIPCGRYKDATYKLISHAVHTSGCRLCILAGACLPDDPIRILDRLPIVDAVMLGDDFRGLAEVAQRLKEGAGWKTSLNSIPGFAWRAADGTVSIVHSNIPPSPIGSVSARFRSKGLSVVVRNGQKQNDRYGKWLIDSSIGCPRQCIYCRTPVISRRQKDFSWRPRKAKEIVDEMEEVVSAHGVDEFRFQDDNFIMPTTQAWERCHEFAEELRRRTLSVHFQIMFHASAITESEETERAAAFDALESVGLERVFLGIESGHDPTLSYFRKESSVAMNESAIKWLSGRELLVICGSVVFHPRTTLEQLYTEHKFFRRWIADNKVAALSPLGSYAHIIPGSELEAEILERGLATKDEAEFRPYDEVAAEALKAMLAFRRYVFTHDWFVFTIKRDLIHWQRTAGNAQKVIPQLSPLIADASIIGIDESISIIEAAASGRPWKSMIYPAAYNLYEKAKWLNENLQSTEFAPYWRAALYAKPAEPSLLKK